ncbi:MAG TPA: hypothetical protein VF927_04145 [Solirubrobacteraceae bacterium]
MSPRRAARLIALGRVAIGVAVLAAPEAVMSRWLGEENARRGGVKDLGRGLAARDIGLALATLQTLDDPVIGPRVQAACAVADGVDALATLIERRSLPKSGVIGTVAVAGGAALVGFYCAHRLAHES